MSVTRWDDDSNPELDWYEASVDDLAALRAWVLDQGATITTANGLVGWIVAGDPESVSKTTRAGYRRLLRTVGPPPSGPVPRSRRTVGQRGAVTLRVLAGAAAGGSALAMAAQGGPVGLSLVLACATPIILDPSVMSAPEGTQRLSVAA